jgi:hypothetical protein
MIVSLFALRLIYQDGHIFFFRKKEPDDLVNQSLSRLLQPYVKVGLIVKKVENPTFSPVINVAMQCFHLFLPPFKLISLFVFRIYCCGYILRHLSVRS